MMNSGNSIMMTIHLKLRKSFVKAPSSGPGTFQMLNAPVQATIVATQLLTILNVPRQLGLFCQPTMLPGNEAVSFGAVVRRAASKVESIKGSAMAVADSNSKQGKLNGDQKTAVSELSKEPNGKTGGLLHLGLWPSPIVQFAKMGVGGTTTLA